jgi:uncharacterized protein YicC (UPF0701 family)
MTRNVFRALAALLLLAGIARADDAEAQRTKFRVQVRTQIEQALATAAGLDPAATARVAAVIDRIDDHVAQLQRDNHAAYLELKQLLEQPQPDPNAVNRLIDRITANRAGVLHAEEDRTREVRRLLTPVQYGKIVIAYPMVNRQIRAHIRRALTDQANAVDDALNE